MSIDWPAIKELQLRIYNLEKQTNSTEAPIHTHDESAKQELLRRNVSIFDIPFIENEDLNVIIGAIESAVNFSLNHSDYNAYRTGANKNIIIISFFNFRRKLGLLQATKGKRSLRSTELGLSSLTTDNPI